MESDGKPEENLCTGRGFFGEISFEVIILFIFGMLMLLFGMLLFKIHTGEIPYSPDSTYGLFLVLVSFQMITLGKTPFGDLPQSWIIISAGMCTAAAGMTACFIPGLITDFVRILSGLLLFGGGIALLSGLFLSGKKAKKWLSVQGIPGHLTIAAAFVYSISVILGAVTLMPGITSDVLTGVILIAYGLSFFYLAWCIHKISLIYPKKEQDETFAETEQILNDKKRESKIKGILRIRQLIFDNAAIPLSVAIIIPVGFLLLLLGFLLFPVNMGIIPFSPDGQLGLLMVVMAIQMMALGETPAGQYTRSWLLMATGVLFASLGIFSCAVPGILTGILVELIGFLNIAGGAILLAKRFGPAIITKNCSETEKASLPPALKKLIIIQTILNFVSIGFGASMFLPGIIPGGVIAGILILNGIMLFALASAVLKLDRMQKAGFA